MRPSGSRPRRENFPAYGLGSCTAGATLAAVIIHTSAYDHLGVRL